MKADLTDLQAFLAVARAGGFRDAARTTDSSASGLSDAVRRLEAKLARCQTASPHDKEHPSD